MILEWTPLQARMKCHSLRTVSVSVQPILSRYSRGALPRYLGVSDFQFGEFRFQPFEHDGEELGELFVRSRPHVDAAFRFVPDFPIFHIVMEAVVPAFRVMADDRGADFGIFFKILWRIRVEMNAFRVFDTRAQAVEDFGARFIDEADDFVRRAENIVLFVCGIKMHQREDVMHVDHPLVGVVQRPVMVADNRKTERFEHVGVVMDVTMGGEDVKARSVKLLADFSCRDAEIGGDFFCHGDCSLYIIQ